MKYPASQYASYLIGLHKLGVGEQEIATKKFIAFLSKNGDLKDWNRIKDTYSVLKDKTASKKNVLIKHTGLIDKAGIEKSMSGYNVDFLEDKALRGGLEIRIGDIRIDNTIRGRLEEIKKTLMQS